MALSGAVDVFYRFHAIENSHRKLVKQFEHDPTVGCIDTDLLSRYFARVGCKAAIIHRRRVVPIPCYFIENSLQKLVKNI